MWHCCKIETRILNMFIMLRTSCFSQNKMSLLHFPTRPLSTLGDWSNSHNYETLTELTFISFWSFVFAGFSINNKYVKLKVLTTMVSRAKSWRQIPSILQIFKETFWKCSNTNYLSWKAIKLFRLIFSLCVIW